MAFAPPPSARLGRATGSYRGKTKVRRLALRRSLTATPAIARAVGMRAATRQQPVSMLVAARFDRSNFSLLTRPESLAKTTAHILMGSSIASLRPAARFSRNRLIFAGQDQFRTRFAATRTSRRQAFAYFNNAR